MKITWHVEESDVAKVRMFYAQHEKNALVVHRFKKNIDRIFPKVEHPTFWRVLVNCLLTTQQRSGPHRAITTFIHTDPFPLDYSALQVRSDLRAHAQSTISSFGGLRFSNKLPQQIQKNWSLLENGCWQAVDTMLSKLEANQTPAGEVEAANFIDDAFIGFGPKQARNLLQSLGVSRFEIPIDSRITKWLNDFNFPVRLSSTALSDKNYYAFISQGFRELCEASDLYPCLLDAAIFSSYDPEWPADRLVW